MKAQLIPENLAVWDVIDGLEQLDAELEETLAVDISDALVCLDQTDDEDALDAIDAVQAVEQRLSNIRKALSRTINRLKFNP
jgi:hypothetical protein